MSSFMSSKIRNFDSKRAAVAVVFAASVAASLATSPPRPWQLRDGVSNLAVALTAGEPRVSLRMRISGTVLAFQGSVRRQWRMGGTLQNGSASVDARGAEVAEVVNDGSARDAQDGSAPTTDAGPQGVPALPAGTSLVVISDVSQPGAAPMESVLALTPGDRGYPHVVRSFPIPTCNGAVCELVIPIELRLVSGQGVGGTIDIWAEVDGPTDDSVPTGAVMKVTVERVP